MTAVAMIRSRMQASAVSPDRPSLDPAASVALNLQRLTEEHDRLQIRTSKLQKQLTDAAVEHEARLQSLRDENNEVRGNLEFISLERNVLSEMVTELEETLERERESWRKEREQLQETCSQADAKRQDDALKE